jgi:6,7-dimethyl-8-ribityllumazine synthase
MVSGFDAVAIFGVIIRGETPHFDYVSQAVTQGATQLSLSGTPIGFGVLTCDNLAQAEARSGISGSKENKGKDTIEALLLSLSTFEQIKQG